MMDASALRGATAAAPSLYDPQQPSTSSHHSQQQQSPAWIESASGSSSHFGTLPEASAAPMDWHGQQQQLLQLQHMQQSQSILMTGGPSMRRQLAAMRLANTAEWAGGVAGGHAAAAAAAASAPVGASPSRTPSMLSLQSEVSGLSGMTACSNLSTMTGLTVRTDYSEAELNRVAHEKQIRGSPSAAVAAAAAAAGTSTTAAGAAAPVDSDESPQDQYIRQVLGSAHPEQVFEWTAHEGSKADPLYRSYRKMALRVYAKKDIPQPGRGVSKVLKLLADYRPAHMRKILEDLMADLQDCSGKDRTDTLHSLYDCASATPEALAALLRQPPRARPGRPEFSIRDVVQCVDPRGDDSVAAARILVRLAEPHLRYDDIRKRGITEDGLRRLLAAVLHEKDVAPNKRIVLIEALKKYNKKSEFLKMEGVASILRFLNKEADENGTAPVPEAVTLVRVEKEEPLLHHVLCFLRSLVVARGGRREVAGASRNRDAFVEQLARHNGVQILAGWLDHGSTRLLHEIAAILGALSGSKQLQSKDLSVAIRSVLQLLGTDDPTFTGHLIAFVKNVAAMSTAHKRSAIDSSACVELLHFLHKWAIASEREPRAVQERWYVSALYSAVEALDVLTESDAAHAHNAALDALLKARELAIPVLLRIATFDFLYPEIRLIFDLNRLQVLQRMCMRVQHVGSLGLAGVKDPLHGEALAVMLWRRMWDMYRQVYLLNAKKPSSTWRCREEDTAPVASTIRTVTYLCSILYADPACFAQVLSLVGVTRDAPDGTKPMLNPFKLLSTPMLQLTSSVLSHVDQLMVNYWRHGMHTTHKHPMEVWLQPRAKDDGGDYKNEFFHAVLTLQGTNWIPGDVAQRLNNYFNEGMGTHSPSITPGGFTHPQHLAMHHHACPPQLQAGYSQQ
ncbi:hypothetical protein PRIPAC_92398 [Pristionchus pacificus]|uniref:Uncharacterized protein n=1 Tax=Pristionchus pacificus TaxID=54126 RepID=A0A2A6BBD0_PRIPA|nr:hypothetical protein PRIPAC_92398 [Pristionchus pacificus]|eukprot:PDM63177.1 hypothetical protein PRIPAC_50392 [Pristionchus pacificus]